MTRRAMMAGRPPGDPVRDDGPLVTGRRDTDGMGLPAQSITDAYDHHIRHGGSAQEIDASLVELDLARAELRRLAEGGR